MSNSQIVSNVTRNTGKMRAFEIVIPVLGTDDFDATVRQLKLVVLGCLAEIAVQYKRDVKVEYLLDCKDGDEAYPYRGFWSATLIGPGFSGRKFAVAIETPTLLYHEGQAVTTEALNGSVDRLMQRVLENYSMPYIESMLRKS